MDKFDDKAFIENRGLWSRDGCCVKQLDKEGEKNFMGYRAFGVIFDNRAPVVIYDHETANETVYASVDAMLADGWVVD